MKKSTKIIIQVVALVLAFVLGGGLGFLLGRNSVRQEQPQQTEQSTSEKVAYTVEIRNEADMPLENVGVYIYTDSSMQDLETFANTDAEGKIHFEAEKLETYVAVLQNLPPAYKPEAYYPITGELTKIVLSGGEMTDEDMESVQYKLGDLMLDFTVVDSDGVEYKLSELLKVRRAVALNFWYIGCDPCKMEFPYLQEAYEEYGDLVEILAMNPMSQSSDDIAAYKEEMGLTFPMAEVDPAWEKMMQITGYPTTVIIDRFGNIVLMHGGAVPDAKTLKDAFAFFTADEYESTVVEDITELAVEEPKGNESNPLEFGGVTSFEVTLEPGQTVFVHLYKVKNRYLQVKNKDCSIKYNDKEYKPTGGSVGFMVSAPDNYTPAKLQFTNNGKEKQTFKATLSALRGSRDNPYALELGEFNASVSAGNDQGVYYRYTATEDGILSLRCLKSSISKFGYSLYNLNSYAMRNLEEDSESDSSGHFVRINVKKGEVVEVCIAALPDSSNNYPAASFKFKAEFTNGLEEEEEKVEKLVYKVTVTDDQGLAMPNVTVWFSKDQQSQSVITDEKGVATLEMDKGTYTAQLSIPQGYILETNSFELTEEKYEITVVLSPKVETEATYKVAVVDGNNKPVANTTVIIGSSKLVTDNNGIASIKLAPATYKVVILAPKGYVANPSVYTFAEGVTDITVVLSESNPGSKPTDPTTPGTDPTDPIPEETVPEETTPKKINYSVTLVNGKGEPITSGIDVLVMNNDNPVDYLTLNDPAGKVATELDSGTYSLMLVYDGPYFYDEAKAVLTAENPDITVVLAEKLSESAPVSESFYISKTIDVPLGSNYVTIDNSQVNYAVENGQGYCFFRFLITEPGVYRFSTSHNVPITDWGTSTFFISNQTTEAEYAARSFDVTMKEDNFAGEGDVKEQLIGIEVGNGNTILTVVRVGDVVLGVDDAPWTVFVSAKAPQLTYNPELPGFEATKSQIYKLSMPSGKSLKYANLSSDTAVLGSDGLYHLNSETGPVLYVNLGPNAPYVSMYNMLGLTGFGGTSFRKIFYNADGTPMMKDGQYVKEDYTDAMLAYTHHADVTYGVYPLNEDIVYMLQNGGELEGWYDSTHPSYLFAESQTPVNEELAWMFAVCYVG